MASVNVDDPSCLFDTSWTIYEIPSRLKYSDPYRDLLRNQNALRTLGRDLKRSFETKHHVDEYGDSDDERVGGLRRVDVSQIEDSVEDESNISRSRWGIVVTFVYERASYKAALFRGNSFDSRYRNDVARIPLLMLRMPAHLSKRVFEFLSSNFEVSPVPAKIPTTAMYRLLGNYMNTLSIATKDRSNDAMEDLCSIVVKDLKISFAFENPISPQLRLFEVNIPNDVLCECIDRRSQARDAARSTGQDGDAIVEALATFFDQHTGLQIPRPSQISTSESIRVAKIACGAFVLAADGKFKLISKIIDYIPDDANLQARSQATSQATRDFLDGIVQTIAK